MRSRVQLLSVTAVFIMVLTACHGIGAITETYVNQKDPKQGLELTGRGTVKSLIAGASVAAPQGSYTLWNDQKITAGGYTKVEDTYVLTLGGSKEWKLKIEPDSSLHDENGDVWRAETRSHTLRPPVLHSW